MSKEPTLEEIKKDEESQPVQKSFELRVKECEDGILNILNASNLPLSVLSLLLERTSIKVNMQLNSGINQELDKLAQLK